VDSNAGVLTQGVTYTVEPLPDGQRFTARQVFYQCIKLVRLRLTDINYRSLSGNLEITGVK
jgi:hypothetical protein